MPRQVYKFRCAPFVLNGTSVDDIFFNATIKDFKSHFFHQLCVAFAQNFNGVFHVSDYHQPTQNGLISTYLYCSCKNYRLIYSKADVEEKRELEFEVWSKTEADCKCNMNSPKVRELRGEPRSQMKEQLGKLTNKQYRDSTIECAKLSAVLDGNLQEVRNYGVIRKARHEKMCESDLDKDDILDIQFRARQKKVQNVASLQTFPDFSAILMKDEWLKILIAHSKKAQYTRLLLDATGNIIRKPYESSSSILNHILLAPIPKNNSQECFLFPVAEMATNDSTSQNIFRFLDLVSFRLRKIAPEFKLADEIGTDFSFANINAIVKLNYNMTIKKLLDLCYDVFESGEISEIFRTLIIPQLCFSHISKNIMEDIKKEYSKSESLIIAALVGGMVTIKNVWKLDVYIKNLITFLASPTCDENFMAAKAELADYFDDTEKESSQESKNETDDEKNVWREEKAIYKSSRFYQHFKTYFNSLSSEFTQNEAAIANKFSNPDFVDTLLKKYIAYLPLWTAFLGRLRCGSVPRANNARIEQYFGGLKSDVRDEKLNMGLIGCIKVGRYITYQEKRTDLLSKEIAIAQPSNLQPKKNKNLKLKHPTKVTLKEGAIELETLTEPDLASQTEKWQKKLLKNNRKSSVFLNPTILQKELK